MQRTDPVVPSVCAGCVLGVCSVVARCVIGVCSCPPGQATEMVLNEFIPFVNDWCDLSTVKPAGSTKCPNSQDPATSGKNPRLHWFAYN